MLRDSAMAVPAPARVPDVLVDDDEPDVKEK